MKSLGIALCLGVCLAVAGCATVPLAGPAGPCGDPCAVKACPSAFVCIVAANCVARCEPEPIKPGTP